MNPARGARVEAGEVARVGHVQRIVALGAGLWLACVCPPPAPAQIVLPGAVAPTPEGTTQAPKPARPRPRGPASPGDEPRTRRGTPVAVPGAAGLAGRTVSLNGNGSQLAFAAGADRAVAVSRISMAGHKISNGAEACRVDAPAGDLALTPLGRPNGLERFRLAFPACPLAFDVLDGAVLVDRDEPACTFAEADCRAEPAGLWGSSPAELGPDKVKGLERTRAQAEAAVRSNYKALVASTKDRPTIMSYAREQAQFSSSREETCRDYADEPRHGYCAAKLTEARAARLSGEVAVAVDAKAARKAARRPSREPN